MGFQPCPGVASLVIQSTIAEGDTAENMLHVYKGATSAWDATALTNLVNGVDTWIPTGDGTHTMLDELQSSFAVNLIQARDLTTSAGPEITKSVHHVGSSGAGVIAAGLAKALTLRTGLSGRSQRGRLFQYGLSTQYQLAGDVNFADPTRLANQVSAWTSLIAAISAIDAAYKWCVLSRFSGVDPTTKKPIPRANGVPTPITSVGFSHTALDYQRRRAPFHARHN